ncbi:acetyl-CoA carboxylase biotin carboxyl carrier protein [Oceanobacillus luteolus]|uniref:Biotin carboxyl carrier protein of acetyl-CoA carboxylase n=1 Tax=Oceanobacillus luteolus TaxID=1274358 RepID=A0ABW4HWR2_9BACI|nr:acetyl-CoA carboxylase biotin carboxyl carrier protein [Oceanobacillus luteolus]MCM3738769.1 acetyl-CoA carboxylase biotin carboxyl carrier protein [Oceanobacillus luteolus]
MLKVQEIREIIKLIDESSITEFNYESNGTTVTLKKGTEVVSKAASPATQVIEVPATAQAQEQTVQVQKEVKQETVKQEKQEVSTETVDYDYEVVSPMVGTFYSAPSPEDDPYVTVGTKVEPQSIVCIVEAMKLFNEIEAEVSGEIVEILVQNGELVEYGQPLFRVKK